MPADLQNIPHPDSTPESRQAWRALAKGIAGRQWREALRLDFAELAKLDREKTRGGIHGSSRDFTRHAMHTAEIDYSATELHVMLQMAALPELFKTVPRVHPLTALRSPLPYSGCLPLPGPDHGADRRSSWRLWLDWMTSRESS